jgi:hypothetical protein
VRDNLPRGRQQLVARYLGDEDTAAASREFTVRIRR